MEGAHTRRRVGLLPSCGVLVQTGLLWLAPWSHSALSGQVLPWVCSRHLTQKADLVVCNQSGHSISSGTLRAPSHRSAASINSATSRESTRAAITRMNSDRSRSRRERTFVGSECAVCEEPLEHTLRGERILQFSCSHVSHEACFYEFIREFESQYCPTCNAPLHLDTSRGGNVIDIGTQCNL